LINEEVIKSNLWSWIGKRKWARALFYFSVLLTLLSPVVATVGALSAAGHKAFSYLYDEHITVQEKSKFTSAYWAGKDILNARFLYGYEFDYNDISYLHSYIKRVTHLGCTSKYLDYKEIIKLKNPERLQLVNGYRSNIEGCLKSQDLGLYNLYKLGENILILERHLFKSLEKNFYPESVEFEIDSINKYWNEISVIKNIGFDSIKLVDNPENKIHIEYVSSYGIARERLWSELGIIM